MPLHPSAIDIWILKKAHLRKFDTAWASVLTTTDLQRAQRLRFKEDARDFILYHACQRIILSKYLVLPPQAIHIATQKKGKPYILNSPIRFNLSHTQNLALLAVTHEIEVGVDIEKNSASRNYLAIAQRYFHPQEYHALLSIPQNTERQALFYRFWTAKEALVKATGEGLASGLKNIKLTIDAAHNLNTSLKNCILLELPMPENYIATVAVWHEKINALHPLQVQIRHMTSTDIVQLTTVS